MLYLKDDLFVSPASLYMAGVTDPNVKAQSEHGVDIAMIVQTMN